MSIRTFLCRIFLAVLLKNYIASLLHKSRVILRYTAIEINWQPVCRFFVQNSGYTRSFIRRFPHSAFWQLASSLWMTTCIKSAVHNLHQACSSQLASSLQLTFNLHQACSSQLAASLQFTTCIKSAVHNLPQVCWQFATDLILSSWSKRCERILI
jgi:hypothetical protein